jgi:hypothetical protein
MEQSHSRNPKLERLPLFSHRWSMSKLRALISARTNLEEEFYRQSHCGIAALCVCVVSIALETQRAGAVQSALRGGWSGKRRNIKRNREAARAPMNAVGEIQSVISVVRTSFSMVRQFKARKSNLMLQCGTSIREIPPIRK